MYTSHVSNMIMRPSLTLNMRQALHVKKDKQSGNFGKGVQSNLKRKKRVKDLESCERVQSYTQFGIPVFKMYCVNLIQKLNNFKN